MSKIRRLVFVSCLLLVMGTAIPYLTACRDVNALRQEVERVGGKVWLASECDKNGTPNGAFVRGPFTYAAEAFSFPTVCTVDLHGTQISKLPGEIASYRTVRCLLASDTQLDDNEIMQLAALPEINRIDISNTKLTQEGVEKLRASLPNAIIVTDFTAHHINHVFDIFNSEIEFDPIMDLDVIVDP